MRSVPDVVRTTVNSPLSVWNLSVLTATLCSLNSTCADANVACPQRITSVVGVNQRKRYVPSAASIGVTYASSGGTLKRAGERGERACRCASVHSKTRSNQVPVSERFISAAIERSNASDGMMGFSKMHTAAGLPENGRAVNASTTTTLTFILSQRVMI